MAIVLKRPRAELDLLDVWDYIADDSFAIAFSRKPSLFEALL